MEARNGWQRNIAKRRVCVRLVVMSFLGLSGCTADLAYNSINSAFMQQAPGWVKVEKFTNKEYPPAETVRVYLRKAEVKREYIELAQLEVIENVRVRSTGPRLLSISGPGSYEVSDETAYVVMLKSFLRHAKEAGADALILLEKKGYSVSKETHGIGHTKYPISTNLESSTTDKLYLKAMAVKF